MHHKYCFANIVQTNKSKIYKIKLYRSSHRRCSVRKGVLGNSAKFTRKHLCQSGTGVFLWILRNFWEHLFAEHLWATASDFIKRKSWVDGFLNILIISLLGITILTLPQESPKQRCFNRGYITLSSKVFK